MKSPIGCVVSETTRKVWNILIGLRNLWKDAVAMNWNHSTTFRPVPAFWHATFSLQSWTSLNVLPILDKRCYGLSPLHEYSLTNDIFLHASPKKGFPCFYFWLLFVSSSRDTSCSWSSSPTFRFHPPDGDTAEELVLWLDLVIWMKNPVFLRSAFTHSVLRSWVP